MKMLMLLVVMVLLIAYLMFIILNSHIVCTFLVWSVYKWTGPANNFITGRPYVNNEWHPSEISHVRSLNDARNNNYKNEETNSLYDYHEILAKDPGL